MNNLDLILSGCATVASLAALAVSIFRRKKPSLAAAVQRAVAYAAALPLPREERIRHACFAIQREDAGDNGKRDWPDVRIRQEVEAHFPQGE